MADRIALPKATRGAGNQAGASLLRLALPDRPGSLALAASVLGSFGVDILRVEVVGQSEGLAVDDLLVAGERLPAALEQLPDGVRVLGCRAEAELPDPAVAMAEACALVAGSSGLGDARRQLLEAAVALASADGGVLLREAGHGWLRPVAATVTDLPPVKAGEPSIARKALATSFPVLAGGGDEWAPHVYRSIFRAGSVLAVPGGLPPYFALVLVRGDGFPFVEAEVERVGALVRVAIGVLSARGEKPVSAPLDAAVRVRVGAAR
jgi:hypothetical protein